MKSGQMIPVPENVDSDRITFLIKEDDYIIEETLNNPQVELQLGHVIFDNNKGLQVLYILCRLSRFTESVYESPFSYLNSHLAGYLLALEGKRRIQLLFSGDTVNSVVNLEIPPFHVHLDATVSLIKKNKCDSWSKEEFLDRISDIDQIFKSPSELWDAFTENENFLSIQYNN